ncbi:hypothetical protein BJX65DRAFT_276080 [Aspergillus insuetus]
MGLYAACPVSGRPCFDLFHCRSHTILLAPTSSHSWAFILSFLHYPLVFQIIIGREGRLDRSTTSEVWSRHTHRTRQGCSIRCQWRENHLQQ